jgi:hypothetical protein
MVIVDPTKSSTLLGGAVPPGGMVSGVEKKPPTLIGEGGTSSPRPDGLIDPDMGTSNAKGPTVTGKGCTFPLGSTLAVKVPLIAVSP